MFVSEGYPALVGLQSHPYRFIVHRSRLRSPPMKVDCLSLAAVRYKGSPSDRYNYTKPASPLSTAEWPEPTYSKLVSGYQVYHHPDSFKLDYGQSLPSFDLAYEVWGELSEKKDNVILLHTGLSASSHAKSHEENRNPGWWEKFIGHGSSYPIDLDRHFVICTNVLGSCYGSTGPHSINPLTGNRYGTEFPIVSIFDMYGGMQSIVAAWLEPERVGKVVSISGCGRSGPSSIAIRYAQRSVLMADPNWNNGFYYDSAPPHVGMKLARQIATITYRSGPEWEQRFGRRRRSVHAHNSLSPPTLSPDFLIETYLDHQGEQFCLKYDANSLLYVSTKLQKGDGSFRYDCGGLNELERYRTEAPSSDEPSFSGQPERDEAGRVSSLSSAGDHEIVTSLAHTFKRFQSTQEFLIPRRPNRYPIPDHSAERVGRAIRTFFVRSSSSSSSSRHLF
ncbi:hypothetical protein H4Q26_017534 [Puccinia striiformis f. sp. tritici PST-130]|nr:hypothetical protein H4Q26_017534 [Puccinia striiformis f. sp. tritici PST-130]